MNKVENSVIKWQIDFERYKTGQANEVIALLDKADAEMVSFIKKTGGVYTKARYKEISKKLRDIAKRLKEQTGEAIDIDGVINYELKKQKKLLNSVKGDIVKVKEGEVNFIFPSLEQIKTAVLFRPITEGMTYDSYLNGIEAGLFNTWDSAVRTGYLTGRTTQEIVRSVMGGFSAEAKLKNPGSINALRNSVYANTRTALQSFANETMARIYEPNERYFGDGEYKYEALGVLDNRQCVVCGTLDGKLFKSLKDAPKYPLHRSCRCMLVPWFNLEGELRSSKNGYVNAKVDFEGWLREQSEKTQVEVLGRTRYKLFSEGVRMSQFVEDGRLLTLTELEERL